MRFPIVCLMASSVLLAGCSSKPVSDVRVTGAGASHGLRTAAPKAFRRWQVGDTWVYECQEVLPATLTIKVIGVRPRADGNGQDFLCAYRERKYVGRGRSGLGPRDGWVEANRRYVFTQYADGSLVSQGSTDGDHITPLLDWVAGTYLPALRSPLTVGDEQSFPNCSVTDPTDSTPERWDFAYRNVGVETVWVAGNPVDAFRVEAKYVMHSRREGDTSPPHVDNWTDWYSPDMWLVRRERHLNAEIFGISTSASCTLTLRQFTRGKP